MKTVIAALLLGAFLVSCAFLDSHASYAPGGRLTLDPSNCVMTSDQIEKTILYYSPCGGNGVPVVNNNGVIVWHTFTSGDTDVARRRPTIRRGAPLVSSGLRQSP